MGVTAVIRRPEVAAAPGLRRTAAEQVGVAGGQLLAGLGNLGFSLLMARFLAPSSFSQLAAFLALYVLIGLPTTSLSAVTALAPGRGRGLDFRVALGASALGLGLVSAAPWLGPALHLTIGPMVGLGLLVPAVGALALERGRLYGSGHHVSLVASLVGEPGVRLGVGVAAGALFGATGAALAVAVAAYAALLVAHRGVARAVPETLVASPAQTGPAEPAARPGRPSPLTRRGELGATLAFLLLAVIQNQDLVIANRVLPSGAAAHFAVLSTLGGAVAFATLTVPLVLLPRAAQGQRHALGAALGVAGIMGAVGVGLAAAFPGQIVTAMFGARYASVAPLAAPYLGAMALLGLSRVVVAHRSAAGRWRLGVALLVGAAAAQASLIVVTGHSARTVAMVTVFSSAGLAAGLGAVEGARWVKTRAPDLVPAPGRRLRSAAATAVASTPFRVVAGLTLAALAVRLVVPRGLWLDEATSVLQARMHFSAMITNLRTTDVQPPGWYVPLWLTVRVLGSGQLAVRVVSIIEGTLLVPVLYLTGREMYDRRTGYVAAALGTIAPFLVWYSQEARMYAQFMLLAAIAVWAQVRIFRRGRPLDWGIFTLATAALIWTQYFAGFQVVVQQVAFLVVVLRRRRDGESVRGLVVGWVCSLLAVAALLAPLAPFAYHQWLVNQRTGKGFVSLTPAEAGTGASSTTQTVSIYSLLANIVWLIWGYHSDSAMEALCAMWPVGMLLGVFVLGRKRQPETTLVLAAGAVPVLCLLGLGFFKANMFDARYFSGAAVMLILVLARVITGAARRKAAVVAATAVLLASFAVGLVDQQTNGSNPRTYQFEQAVQALNVKGQRGDTVYYAPGDIGTVIGYYDRGRYALRPLSPNLTADPSSARLYVVLSRRLMSPGQPASYGKVLYQLGRQRQLMGRMSFDNIQIWEFASAR